MSGKVSVLIVADKAEGRFTLCAVLRADDSSYDMVVAGSGPEAIERVGKVEFAVILLAVQVPGMDGFEAAKKIREISQDVPIIFITAISRDEIHVFRGYDSGAVDYLFKPLNGRVLQSKVAVFAELFRKN